MTREYEDGETRKGEAPEGRGSGCHRWMVRQLNGVGEVTTWPPDWQGR